MANKEATQVSPSAAVKKTTAKSSKPAHPSTADMVSEAIATLKERGGSSVQAIKKYIAGTYMLDSDRLASYIKKHIKASVASGALVQTKGKGASGSFKLPPGKTNASKTKKTVTKTSTAKKAVSPKKTVKKSTIEKKTESAAPKKSVAVKKPATKKPASAEKTKKATSAKPAANKAAKSPSKAKKVSKAPTTKPKAPKPKKIAASKNTTRKTAAKK